MMPVTVMLPVPPVLKPVIVLAITPSVKVFAASWLVISVPPLTVIVPLTVVAPARFVSAPTVPLMPTLPLLPNVMPWVNVPPPVSARLEPALVTAIAPVPT